MIYYFGEYVGTWNVGSYPYVHKLVRYNLGDCEKPFSYSDALNEKPATCKYVVNCAIADDLKKNTILYDGEILKYWVVVSDTSELTDTIGSVVTYKHTIECEEAFEFLNGTELPNCAFKSDRYTNTTFINRLFSISKFTIKTGIAYSGFTGMSANGTTKFKSYDGYTLASAIRDIGRTNGYIPKLTFTTAVYSSVGHPLNGLTYISSISLSFISRIGIGNTPFAFTSNAYNEQNKGGGSNYCVSVVSDIKNARSSIVNKYPNFGGVSPFSLNTQEVKIETAEIKLPSKIDEVVSVTVYPTGAFTFYERYDYENETTPTSLATSSINNCFTKEMFITNLENSGYTWAENLTSGDKVIIKEALPSPDQFTVRNSSGSDTFDERIYVFNHFRGVYATTDDKYIYLKNKVYRDTIENAYKQDRCMYWEQGGNTIKGMAWNIWKWNFGGSSNNKYALYYFTLGSTKYVAVLSLFATPVDASLLKDQLNTYLFKVTYYPQIELKVKYDSSRNGMYEKFYNQTGKTIDGYSAGKMLISYVDESSSSVTIKQSKVFAIGDILPLGSVCTYNGKTMVIGEVSVEVHEDTYFNVVYSLSTDRVGRSEDISADSYIKDTDTPQLNNIIRKQVYRDYLELAYADDYTVSTSLFMGTPSMSLSNFLVFSDTVCGFEFNCCCYIKGVDSAGTVYYRGIDAIEIDLPKQKMIVADFQDNNIIGYYRERKVSS